MKFSEILKRAVKPLASRKVRVAFATVIAAYLVQWLPDTSEQTIYTILSVGVALILGIAHEDNGKLAQATPEKPSESDV